jgi:tetraacyldisaccharide 4'-kinase
METILMQGSRWRCTLYACMQGHAPASLGLRMGLTPFWLASHVYRGAIAAQQASYAYGLRRRKQLPCRVISIGNLTLGGTGKTPLTLWVARWFQKQGWRVAVLSRGYGGQPGNPCQVVSTGGGPLVPWHRVGDEPYLLARALPGIPVLVAPDRYVGGRYACDHLGTQVMVLDDGFQHIALHRDLDVVLIDSSNPFGHGALIPRGVLREPLHALQRADAIVLTRTDMAQATLPSLCEQIRRCTARQPIYAMKTVAEALLQDGQCVPEGVARLQQQRVVAFAGIGNSQSFAFTLARLGIDVAVLFAFPDHHPYSEEDWRTMITLACQRGAACLVTTEKDAVRLAPEWQSPVPVYALRIGVRFVGAETAFEQHLQTLHALS